MKPQFEYQGYFGSGEVSVEDNLLHGRLLFIKDIVNYAAESPKELEAAFRDAVDDYLDTCRELGEEPDTPFKGTFNVRFTQELHRDCALAAIREGVSLNDWVKSACKSHLAYQNVEVHHHHHETRVILSSEETIPLPDIDFSQFGRQEDVWQSSLPN
ncbi:MAG: type II toxin-antitoxin system HicB family antitoxin [Thiobacillus sp.]|nr:type II toxin-antitoxin system HicB family antitoxin [Thiobacillus sp.]